MRIAIATCLDLPEPDPDEELFLDALRAAGMEPSLLAWDDAGARFGDHDLVVVRSTWNYWERVDDFVAWATRVGETVPVYNPPRVIAWNVRKSYLEQELARRGVPVVPTEVIAQGTTRDLATLSRAHGWQDVVIKPLVSAGSYRTERFGAGDVTAGQRFLDDLVRDRDAMVQPWMPAVETHGERSLVWIDGELTHAIRKAPRYAGGVERVTESTVAEDERALAAQALGPFADELLYARVDMIRGGVRGDDDGLRVMELELVEPSLFLRQCPAALERLVAAIRTRGDRSSR